MTKTLTEQWREGKLKRGCYFIKLYGETELVACYNNICDTFHTDIGTYTTSVKEVLAPVLPYRVLYDKDQGIFPVLNIVLRNIEREQCQRKLTDLELSIKSQVKGVLAFNGLVNKTYKSFGNTEQLERLQEQLKEANEVIKNTKQITGNIDLSQFDYEHRRKIEGITMETDSYLEKWGVK